MEVLRDADIERIPLTAFVAAIRAFVIADFEGHATAPPRQSVQFPTGRIAFTSGGVDKLAGFRAYETFASNGRTVEEQIVALWNTETCALEGVCIGSRLGAVRTGVLGGIAVDALAPPSIGVCVLIGSGRQAETQLLGILATRKVNEIHVYSRDAAHCEAFVERLAAATSVRMLAFDRAEDAVAGADVVVLATNSATPVIDAAVLEGVAHITTVGPKSRDAHELPLAAAAGRLLVSDSPQQVRAQGEQHMLHGERHAGPIHHLGALVSTGRPPEPRRTLYLSAGLAGTEVVALAAALRATHAPNLL